MTKDQIKRLELFLDMPDSEIDWMMNNGEIVTIEAGTYFYRQDHPVDVAYVTLEGELQVSRSLGGVIPQVFGTTPPGVLGGEMALLMAQDSLVNAQAIVLSRLLVFDRETFQDIFAFAPTIGARILTIATNRLANIGRMMGQREKQSALGRLSAGLAHELNNPASAARRAAQTLRDVMPTFQHYTMALNINQLPTGQADALIAFQEQVLERESAVDKMTAMERSDREEQIAAVFENVGIEDGYALASNFIEHNITPDDVLSLCAQLDAVIVATVFHWLDSALTVGALMNEIDGSTQRISRLVDAVKAYTYMDQGEFQNVDIHKGLENIVTIMAKKIGGRVIERNFDKALPNITGRGSDLNEVWSNVIQNAIEATPEAGGRISLITRVENDSVMVEIADNGHGISDEILANIFDPFFTTKPLGEGLGLGLEVSNRIIIQHSGSIDLQSKPGQTRVIVRLPVRHSNTY